VLTPHKVKGWINLDQSQHKLETGQQQIDTNSHLKNGDNWNFWQRLTCAQDFLRQYHWKISA